MPPKKIRKSHQSHPETLLVSKDQTILTRKYNQIKKVTGASIIQDFEPLLQPPDGVTVSDWLIINVMEFLDKTDKLYQCCSLFCTTETCPLFNAGPHYNFFWEDESIQDPVQLSAPEYLLQLTKWARRNLANTALFPRKDGLELSADAYDVLRAIYRRTIRIYAHLYVCHFSSIKENGIEPVINTVFGHYSQLALRYQMIDEEDIEMLMPVFNAMHISSTP
ncbi:Mob1/phocein family protein [Trichomonas vaginalis G3]|uniref:Mob1/phocein family protein n=1 Tax=Trichomonas vaginalis (strain ATCC PRA-98 / G3) TaxID=412133 RepID=A2DH44_TRIV3|nr:hippo signaling [Trichomonas vaginalis G3]EAY20354.1 Mob1/phocein family protein [Trichomonas vaginalis G3]KAI5530655.1 hippo signaling [Trichomonas vaginalis G3]|eukprot:XP_001581340.1 Mob1/phocein family protein [Trichomonas vaginalis G3]